MTPVSRLLSITLVLAACAREVPRAPEADSPASARPITWAFDAPPAWDDRVTLVDEVQGTGTYRSARLFTYTPRDTSIVPQALLGIFVYDSAAWAAVGKEGGPPMGDSIMAVGNQVFIATLPQSNPFAAGSADFRTFDSLAVDLPAVRRRFRVAR